MIEKILQFLISILQRWQNRESLKVFGTARSSQWPRVRNEYFQQNPQCVICGSVKSLQIHHILPFHKFPELELDKRNLITLCDEKQCHLRFGHLYNFASYNDEIREDATQWRNKIMSRPQ